MPKPGQATVTIRQEVYNLAHKQAVKEKRSVANYVTKLILEDKE